MDKLKQSSIFKLAFRPEDWKIEEYVTEISIPENFLKIQPGETPHNVVQFPTCEKFPSGILSETPLGSTFYGSFNRTACHFSISQFYLPGSIGNTILTIKPFRVELLPKNIIIAENTIEFPKQDNHKSFYEYNKVVDLTSIWGENVDMIRITFNIHVHKSPARFEKITSNKVEVKEIETDQFNAMKKEMTSFHNSQDFSDATIRCGTRVIPVHRCILASASSVFRNMFSIDMKEKKAGEVVIKDIESNIIELLIKWIYTGNVEIIELQDQMDLFKSAHKYQVEPLKNYCIAQICARISHENVLAMYAFGDSYEELKLKNKALQVMKANKSKVFSDPDSKEFILRYPELALELIKG